MYYILLLQYCIVLFKLSAYNFTTLQLQFVIWFPTVMNSMGQCPLCGLPWLQVNTPSLPIRGIHNMRQTLKRRALDDGEMDGENESNVPTRRLRGKSPGQSKPPQGRMFTRVFPVPCISAEPCSSFSGAASSASSSGGVAGANHGATQ